MGVGREGGREGHTGRGAESEHGPCGDGGVGGCGQGSADADVGGGGFDDGSQGAAAVGIEEVAGAVDLAVEVVRRAGAAEATARGQHGGIREEDADGVVIARDGEGGDLGEGGGDRVPYLGLQLGAVVREGDAVALAAGDEDCSCRKDNCVGEDPGIIHWADGLDGGCTHRGTDRDDMGVCRRIGVLL